MSKYMLIMRPTDAAFAAGAEIDFEEIIATIGAFNQELIRAGVLLAVEGLDPVESVLEVSSNEEAVEWAKRMPYTQDAKVEIRRVTRIDELPQDNEWIRKERAWRESTGRL